MIQVHEFFRIQVENGKSPFGAYIKEAAFVVQQGGDKGVFVTGLRIRYLGYEGFKLTAFHFSQSAAPGAGPQGAVGCFGDGRQVVRGQGSGIAGLVAKVFVVACRSVIAVESPSGSAYPNIGTIHKKRIDGVF